MGWRGIVGQAFTAEQFDDYVKGLDLRALGDFRPKFTVVHNTSNPTLFPVASLPNNGSWQGAKTSPEKRVKLSLVRYYRDDLGWEAGPHLFIANDFIWAFTPLWLQGTHTPSWNKFSWGLETVGEYDVEPFYPEVKANLVAALTTLHRKMGWDPAAFVLGKSGLHFHKEDKGTTHHNCPGKNIVKADLVAAVRARLGSLPPAPVTPVPDTTNQLTVQTDGLNVRDDASSKAKVVGTMDKGEIVKVLETKMNGSTKWARVQGKELTGWVAARFLR